MIDFVPINREIAQIILKDYKLKSISQYPKKENSLLFWLKYKNNDIHLLTSFNEETKNHDFYIRCYGKKNIFKNV